ncbi:MAG TPA: endolytic transglycosylase MltG [Nocardioidaceae bacterium]|nr:endolytic transglycosylase MltG [Nocardioidaceae bacterium]
MSDVGLDLQRGRRRRRRRFPGCLAVLVALAVIVGGGYVAFSFGLDALKARFSPPPDYSGPGTGSVVVQVKQGDAASDIAATLEHKDVVKSIEAFTAAARNDPKSVGIQVGFYQLKHHMPAQNALKVLEDPHNLLQSAVTIPEGWTVKQIVHRLAQQTDFKVADFEKVLKDPQSVGLPSYAHGKPEGYLYPATYMVPPNATPTSILTKMVDRYKQAAHDHHISAEAAKLGYGPHDLVIVASLVQSEARRDKDFGKVARVIYNRLHKGMKLQFDSTLHYVLHKKGKLSTTIQETKIDSPYNTYKYAGLPPTPISAPGDKAIAAALDPPAGSWLYFVTVNPRTGETKFSTSYSKFLKNKQEYTQYCQTSDVC